MAIFNPAFKLTNGHEGGYVNHKNDRGGKTNYGYTEKLIRSHGYKGKIKDININMVKEWARVDFWNRIKGDSIKSQKVANEIYDTCFNTGVSGGSKLLQRCINIFNYCKNKKEIVVDGKIGKNTIRALNNILAKYELQFLKCLNGEQYLKYKKIVEKNPSQKVFFIGWMRRV